MRTVYCRICGYGIILATLLVPSIVANQAHAQNKDPHRVAVIDIGYIFENNAKIKTELSNLETEMKAFDSQIGTRRDSLKTEAAKLKGLKVGSPEYTAKENELASMDTKLRLDITRARKEFAEKQAKVYYNNYSLISDVVKRIAEFNKINMVLRYNSEEMDLDNPQSVMMGVMKPIVYYDAQIDLTKPVMQYLEQMNAQVAGRPAAGSAK